VQADISHILRVGLLWAVELPCTVIDVMEHAVIGSLPLMRPSVVNTPVFGESLNFQFCGLLFWSGTRLVSLSGAGASQLVKHLFQKLTSELPVVPATSGPDSAKTERIGAACHPKLIRCTDGPHKLNQQESFLTRCAEFRSGLYAAREARQALWQRAQ
jgi:hypothetical protein